MALFRNAPFGKPEEADIEIVEVEFLDAPFLDESLFVRLHESVFFRGTDSGEGVVGRIPQYHQDGLVALDGIGLFALLLKLLKGQPRLLLVRRLPAGERIG
jgi:hypothetical protein